MKSSSLGAVKIACEGADLADLDELVPFQGLLKVMNEEEEAKLISEILTTGYTLPMKVWKLPTGRFYKDKKWIIGGHQTQIALRKIRDLGHQVPLLPIVYSIASTEDEAKDRVLQDISQYGTVSAVGLHMFIGKTRGADVLERRFKFPELKWSTYRDRYYPQPGKQVTFTARPKGVQEEEEQRTLEEHEHKCPRCGFGFGPMQTVATTILRKK